MSLKSSLPQGQYFTGTWTIPGTSNWTLTGHSRALERTGFWIAPLRIMLDAGVDLPTDSGARPAAIMVTHGHIDHMNALPMLLRHRSPSDPPTQLFAPAPIVHRLQQFLQLSWAVKVDDEQELPDMYAGPTEEQRQEVLNFCRETSSSSSGSQDSNIALQQKLDNQKTWNAVKANQSMEIQVGKKNATPLVVHTLRQFHGLCSSVGYHLSTPAGTRKSLRPDLQDDKCPKQTGMNVQQAKARGEETHVVETTPEVPHFAFVLDTTVDALDTEKSSSSPTSSPQRILSCPVVMIECTYLEDEKRPEAERRGHVWWGGLLPYVRKCHGDDDNNKKKTWVLVHFSLRYKDQDIVSFFEDETKSGIRLLLQNEKSSSDDIVDAPSSSLRPPDVVLWLDAGPQELWIESFV